MSYESVTYYNQALCGLSVIEGSIAQLLKSVHYLNDAERQQLVSCCFFAANAHDGQKRRSGEPYTCHPIKVAEILAKEVQFDLPVLQAAVLHDVIEDTDVGKAVIVDAFSQEVADLVDGVSKLEKDKGVSPQELQARTFTKLVVAMEADPRVVMIKFADRMHNMQTLGALRPEKRQRIARETLDVYVPIASRLGMFVFKTELEELAFHHLYPWRYRTIKKLIDDTHPEREATYEAVKSHLMACFNDAGIKASIRKRRRNLLDVYKKLKRKRLVYKKSKRKRPNRRPLEKASIPLIVITEDNNDCYRVLGIIHDAYTPVFKKLADYIASPKVNAYQSIHTSVLTEDHRVINFQIRSKAMHAVAESGIIAIWREHNQQQNDALNSRRRRDKSMRRWLGNIKDLRSLASNPIEFYEAVKRDLNDFDIQVLTPKGEPIALPEGATVIDFAYHIHTDLGNHLKRAQVNGVDVSLTYQLSHGQTVELFPDPAATPKSVWLKRIRTARARTAIRHCLRDLSEETLVKLGLEEMTRYLAKRNIHYRYLKKMLSEIAEKRQMTLTDLLKKIALQDTRRKRILTELQEMASRSGIVARVTIVLLNQPGALAAVADTIGRHEANIFLIDFSDDMLAPQVSMSFEIQIELSHQLEHMIGDLMKLPLVKQVKYEEHSE